MADELTGVTPEPKNPYLETALSGDLATGAAPEGNAYLGLLEQAEDFRKTQLNANVSQAVGTNPDQYATQRRVAKYLGYPVAAVEAMPEQSQQQAKMKEVQQAAGVSPVLQAKYTDADFAKLAHDDSGSLASVAEWFTASAKYAFSHPDAKNTLLGDVGAGIYDTSRGGGGLARAGLETTASLLRPIDNALGGPLQGAADFFAADARVAESKAKQLSPAQSGNVASGVSSGVRSFTQNALLLPLAFVPGGQPVALGGMAGLQGGQSYQQGREQGLSVLQALPFAASQAAIEYATERLPLHRLIGDVKAAAPLWQTIARQAGLEIPGEQVATVLQDLNEWAVLPENQAKPFTEYLKERPNAAAQTLIATVVGVGGNVAVARGVESIVGDAQERAQAQQAAQQDAQRVKQLFAMASQSKLRERSPDTFGDLVQELAENNESAPKEVRFDGRTLADTLAQSGIDEVHLSQIMPSAVPQLQEAIATGGEVSVPIGEFTSIIGTDLEQTLLEHARVGENELSQAEAKEASSQAEEFLRDQAASVAEQGAQAIQTQAGAEAVRANVLDQLNTTGRFTPDANVAYATLTSNFYSTLAERLGTTPGALFAQYPLSIAAENPAEPGAFLNQDDQAQPGGDAPEASGGATEPGQEAGQQAKASKKKGKKGQPAVEQPQPSKQRGAFNPETNTVALLNAADLTSFLHESGHFYLEIIADLASQPSAPVQVQEDAQALLNWFGYKGTIAEWKAQPLDKRRANHEKFAEGFEQYLLEGKAPSAELQPVFQRFRSWLVNVYKGLTEFLAGRDIQLSDEVRSVMDRLIATDEQIKQTESLRRYAPLFKSAEQAGMTPQQWAAYQAQGQKATDAALDNLQARSIKDMRWLSNAKSRAIKALQKDAADKRKAVRDEVEAEVNQLPEVLAERALDALQVSPDYAAALSEWKEKRKAVLDEARERITGELVAAEGEELKGIKKGQFLARNKRTIENQADAQALLWERENPRPKKAQNASEGDLIIIADSFGFSGPDEMLLRIDAMGSKADLIQSMTDQRALERFGDLGNPDDIERAANEAVHNEARGRFVATEYKALIEAMGRREETGKTITVRGKDGQRRQYAQTTNALVSAAKQFAQNLVSQRKVRELRPGQHTTAETRAAQNAERAIAKGDTQAAIVAKRDQLLNYYAGKATNEAIADVERGVLYLKKFDKEGARKRLPPEYLDQIEKLLERVDLRRTSNAELDRRGKLSSWIEEQRAMGIEPDIPDYLLEDVQLTSYREMRVEEFRGLLDTVRQIEHLGKLKNKLLTAKDQREFAEIRDSIVDSIIENAGDRKANTRSPTTNLGRALSSIKEFGAAHIKAATLARIMDGGKDAGPLWEYLIRPANEAGDMETTMRAKATMDLSKIMTPLLKRGKLGGNGAYFPSIDRNLNRESILAIALNVGNEGNLQRLLGGEGWIMDQIAPVLDTLTQEDWAAVQSIWDYFETFRPQIAEKERRIFGKEPDWIEPGSPITQAYGVKGGYYPIKYDPSASKRAEEHADAEGARRQLQGAYGAATTRRSFTKSRAEEVVGRPLLYTLSGVYSGVNEVIHDLAWHEWLIDTNRLLKSSKIDGAMREKYGPEVVKQFKTWRDDIAEGDSGPQHALDMMLGKLRQSVSVAGLGFNVVSAMMQPLGLTQSIQRVGLPWVSKGLWQFIGSPVEAGREVNEKSEFMANRSRTRFRELNELRNRVQGQSGAKRVISENAYVLMMAFQRMVDVPTWIGGYEKAIADGQDEARAIALADQAVIDSQGGGQTKDLSAIERGPQALKLFTTFYSFMNTALNLGVSSAKTPRSRARLASDMMLLFVVPAVLGSLLKDALTPGDAGDDDEELAKKLAADQLSYLLGMVVIGREFGQIGQTLTGGYARDYTGPAGVRAITDVMQFAKQAAQGEFDDSFRKASINLTGDLLGIPSAQINRSITGAQALSEGKTENPAAVVFGYQEPR